MFVVCCVLCLLTIVLGSWTLWFDCSGSFVVCSWLLCVVDWSCVVCCLSLVAWFVVFVVFKVFFVVPLNVVVLLNCCLLLFVCLLCVVGRGCCMLL